MGTIPRVSDFNNQPSATQRSSLEHYGIRLSCRRAVSTSRTIESCKVQAADGHRPYLQHTSRRPQARILLRSSVPPGSPSALPVSATCRPAINEYDGNPLHEAGESATTAATRGKQKLAAEPV